MSIAITPVAARQATLLGLLACPTCHSTLTPRHTTSLVDLLWSAELYCATCDGRVGVVLESKPSFLERDFNRFENAPANFKIDGTRDLVPTGRWARITEGWRSMGDQTDVLMLDATCEAISVTFHTHDWSGEAEIRIDGVSRERQDLYSPAPGELTVRIPLDTMAPHRLEIHAAGSHNQFAHAAQVIVRAVHVWVDPSRVPVPEFGPVNRGNPYPPYFLELLGSLPTDAVALDAGGGDRQVGDERLFNLEYLPYTAPDVYGDGLCLPFQDDSFDLILSQAVLEHVPDPQRAVDELHRVLKPGGTMYVEIAFTQPLHAVPSHYFNVTPFGAEHLFRGWKSASISWFGGVSDTVTWWSNLVDLHAKWPPEQLAQFTSLLAEFDATIGYDDLKYFASAVAVRATK
ncbi:MAG: class I SAM-dependent methyltransferase [Ilumatobacteraceae bacterium]